MDWRFELRVQLHQTPTDAQLSQLMESAARDNWDVTRDPIGLALVTYGPSPRPAETLRDLWAQAVEWLSWQDLRGDVVDGRVMTEAEHEAEALRADTPELLAATDVAELLGVSRQRVHQLAERPDFPAPYARLGNGPIWTRPTIETFAQSWTRKPGRPARKAS